MYKWLETSRKKVLNNKIFSLFDIAFKGPKNQQGVFHVLETKDWVNVIVQNEKSDFIVVEQFRFGTSSIEMEFVAGVIDKGESPEQAALRETLEECGVKAESIIKLGTSLPNPAFLNNTCHHFLVQNAKVTQKQSLDEFEDIKVSVVREIELVDKMKNGSFNHSLSLSAWSLFKLHSDI